MSRDNIISIGDKEYSFGKLDARKQFHIVRRLAPVFTELGKVFESTGGSLKDLKAIDVTKVNPFDALKPIGEILAGLSDEDADYIVFGLLETVQRQESGGRGWANVSTGKALMFDDIDLNTMLQLAGRSLMANLGNFFDALPSTLPGATQAQSGSTG